MIRPNAPTTIFHPSFRIVVVARDGWGVHRPAAATLVSSLWCAQLQRDLYTLGLQADWSAPDRVAELAPTAWKARCRTAVQLREQAHWWRDVQSRSHLAQYASLKQQRQLQREAYLEMRHGGWNESCGTTPRRG